MSRKKVFCILAGILLLVSAASVLPAAAGTQYVDDFGREAVIPDGIVKVIPSGKLAMSVLMSFDPESLASCGSGMPPASEKYLPRLHARNLSMTGTMFAATSTVNYEEIIRLQESGADLLIDVGQMRAGVAESLDTATELTGMPSVFVSQNNLSDIPESYRKIGILVGDPRRGEELASYMQKWVDIFTEGMKKVDESGIRASAVHISDIDGNTATLMGGFTPDRSIGYAATPVNTLTANAVTAKSRSGTGDSYNMEELARIFSENEPDFIFVNGAAGHRIYRDVVSNPAFAGLSAVRNGRVFEIPTGCPYLWTGEPFSGWGICSMIWMANILYPSVFDYDAEEKIQEFYRIVIGYSLTSEEYRNLTAVPDTAETPVPLFGCLAGIAAAAAVIRGRR